MNKMKIISPFLFLLFLSQCFYCFSQDNDSFLDEKIIPIDTLTIPHEITMPASLYSSEYNTQINYYFIEENDSIKFVYCVDSIMPTSKFYIKEPLNSYLAINKEKIIVRYYSSKDYLVMNNQSMIIDTLNNNLKIGDNSDIIISSFYYQFPIQCKNGEYLIYTELNEYKDVVFNWDYRKEKYSLPPISEIKITADDISFSKSFGEYPEKYRSEKGMFMSMFFTSINKNNEVFLSFYEIDSFYVAKSDKPTLKFPFKSKLKTSPFHFPDSIDIDDPYNRSLITSENIGYTYNFFDSYREQYYIVVNHTQKYENEDGTLNDLSQRPWSIIVINKDFKQVDEIEMPKHLNKHEIFIIPEGIAVSDYSLSSEEETVFVVLKIKQYE